MQKALYEQGEKTWLCQPVQVTHVTTWRNAPETLWLADAPVHPLEQALKDLEQTYTNFFAKRADFPRF